MRFSTRVLMVLLGAAVVTHGVLFALLYRSARDSLFQELRVQVANIAATGALVIDAEGHERIQGEGAMEMPEYEELVMTLRQIRDANRREDMRIKFVYTARPNPEFASGFDFVGDAEENPDDVSLYGDEFPDLPEKLRLDEARADENYSTDQWGTWLSASAPIRDASGKPVAVLGVDVAADSVEATLAVLKWQAAGALGIAFVLAAAIAWSIYRWVHRPILAIEHAVEQVGRGDFQPVSDLPRGDEFERVAKALESAARALREREALKENLARVVGDRVAGQLAVPGETGKTEAVSTPSEGKVALLFAGFRDASTHLANEGVEDAPALIEELCAEVIEGVVEFGGEVASFHQDGLLAVFSEKGSGGTAKKPAVSAVKAAFKVRRQAEKLFWRWMAEDRLEEHPWLGVSVDVPAGKSEEKEVGITGRIVSINGLTRDLSIGVLASADIAQAVGSEIPLRPAGEASEDLPEVYGS